jgi:hypothetical protein
MRAGFLALVACSEYELDHPLDTGPVADKPVGADEPDTAVDASDSDVPADPSGDDPGEPEPGVPRLPCDDAFDASMPWVSTGLWYSSEAPRDSADRAWFERHFDDTAWSAIGPLPDSDDSASDHDVFYRARFHLDQVEGTTRFKFTGNDGVWLYVNGELVGHWGGDWRGPGCINDQTGGCSVNYVADPVDVTDYLVPGLNVVAVMLTNGPSGYWLDIDSTCDR